MHYQRKRCTHVNGCCDNCRRCALKENCEALRNHHWYDVAADVEKRINEDCSKRLE